MAVVDPAIVDMDEVTFWLEMTGPREEQDSFTEIVSIKPSTFKTFTEEQDPIFSFATNMLLFLSVKKKLKDLLV